MKNHGNSKTGTVKKYRYVAPQNGASSHNFPKDHYKNSPGNRHATFDFENVWSVRKNVSVGFNSGHSHSSSGLSAPAVSSQLDPPRGSFYSRHHCGFGKPNNDTAFKDKVNSTDLNAGVKSWQSGSNNHKFARNDSPLSDGFDFELPSTSSKNSPAKTLPSEESHRKLQPLGNVCLITGVHGSKCKKVITIKYLFCKPHAARIDNDQYSESNFLPFWAQNLFCRRRVNF